MATIVHFDIASEDVERGKGFYKGLFNWKFEKPSEEMDYYLIDTTDDKGNSGPRGGMGERQDPTQKITVYFGVDDIEKYSNKVKELGGKVTQDKMPVPGWGYLCICTDTEGNSFGLWQEDKTAH